MLPDLSIWAVALAGIGITVFTIAAAFLSEAIQESRKKEDETQKKKANDFELKVADLQNKVSELKSSGDSTRVEEKLKEIKQARKKFDKEIKRIHAKYSSIQFGPSIALPGAAFLVAFVCSELYKSGQFSLVPATIIWFAALLFLAFGTYRILRSLSLIQEISLAVDSQKTRMKQAFQEALAAHDQQKEEHISISFPKHKFPLLVAPSTEVKLNFRVSVDRGKSVHNCEAWFFVPDGFELINPPKEVFRQPDDFVVPNIRTVRVQLGTATKGTFSAGTFTFRTPTVEGTYYVLCRAKSDESSTERSSLEFTVKQ
jgi:ABC-type transport system involved in cytochrome bd biosynthesis fused ATPase/permease subunit